MVTWSGVEGEERKSRSGQDLTGLGAETNGEQASFGLHGAAALPACVLWFAAPRRNREAPVHVTWSCLIPAPLVLPLFGAEAVADLGRSTYIMS